MDQSNIALISFIVRINIEIREGEAGYPRWHGSITHVQSKEHLYFIAMSVMNDFIRAYLQEAGVDIGPWPRLRLWLQRRGRT